MILYVIKIEWDIKLFCYLLIDLLIEKFVSCLLSDLYIDFVIY